MSLQRILTGHHTLRCFCCLTARRRVARLATADGAGRVIVH